MIHSRKWAKVGALALSFALVAAACGDDDDDSGDATETTAAASETTAAGTDTTAGSSDTTSASTDGGEGLADDAIDGDGAEAFEAAVLATQDAPLVAEGEPFVISMANLEGSAGGTFPDIREGAEAAVKMINEQLGGIGADYETGTPGRPIELKVCSHLFDQAEAQKCGNQIAGENPNLVINGVEFFTPLLYPLFTKFPTMETVPIFVADFDQPGVISAFGGCAVAFTGSAKMIAEVNKHDKLAVIWSNTPPGQQCWTDTQERFHQYYKDQGVQDFKGFPDESGDPSDNDAVINSVNDFLKDAENGAIYFGIQSSDCVEFIKGLVAAGVDAQIYAAGSCVDETVEGLSEFENAIVEFQGYYAEGPTTSEYAKWELGVREAAIDAYGPEAAKSAFMRTSFAAVFWAWETANQVQADGGDPWDAETFRSALASVSNAHIVGYPPVDCSSNPAEFESVCKRTLTYFRWNGSGYEPEEGLQGEWLDVTDLILAVSEAYPRG